MTLLTACVTIQLILSTKPDHESKHKKFPELQNRFGTTWSKTPFFSRGGAGLRTTTQALEVCMKRRLCSQRRIIISLRCCSTSQFVVFFRTLTLFSFYMNRKKHVPCVFTCAQIIQWGTDWPLAAAVMHLVQTVETHYLCNTYFNWSQNTQEWHSAHIHIYHPRCFK